jgi:hypothetical protein
MAANKQINKMHWFSSKINTSNQKNFFEKSWISTILNFEENTHAHCKLFRLHQVLFQVPGPEKTRKKMPKMR